LDAPVAKLVGTHEVESNEKIDLQAAQPSAEREETLTVAHPAMFRARPFRFLTLLLVIAAGLAGAAWWCFNRRMPAAPTSSRQDLAIVYVCLGVAGFGLVCLAAWSVAVRSTKLVITTKRTLLRRGLIAKATSEVLHKDVNLLNVEQRFLERIFNVG